MFATIGKAISGKIIQVRGDSLRAKSARGSLILSVGTVSEQVFRFGLRMILTRLLAPEHLGLMVIVTAVSGATEAFTEVGVKQSIVQNKNGAQLAYLNVAWWFQAVRGFFLYGAAFFLAPLVCKFYFYDNPELLALYGKAEILILLRVAFLTMLFNGVMSPRAHVLQKEFRFGKLVFLEQGSSVIGALLTITMLFYVKNVWALVLGLLAERMLRTLASYVLCPFVPRMSIDRASFGELTKFARGMFGLPILVFVATQAQFFVLGKVVSMGLVGMYVMAVRLSNMPHKLVTKVINPVLLPAFAEKQDDKKKLCSAILELSRAATALGTAVLGFMAIYSTDVLAVVYGGEYTAVSVPFRMLCAYYFVTIQSKFFGGMFLAMGLSGMHRWITAVRAVLIVGLIYPGIVLFGLAGAPGIMFAASVVGLCIQVVVMRKTIGLKSGQYLLTWLPGLRIGVILLIPRILLGIVGIESVAVNLVIGSMSCVVACVFGLSMIKRIAGRSSSNRQTQMDGLGGKTNTMV